MSFIAARPVKPKATKTGISFSSRTRGSDRAEIFLTADAQQEHFGEYIKGWAFTVLIGRGDDEGKILLCPVPENAEIPREAVTARNSLRDGVKICIMAWDLLGPEKQAGKPCKPLDFTDRGLLIELPEWCQPAARKAREMSAARKTPPPKPPK